MTPEFLLRDTFYRGRKFLSFDEHYYTQNADKQEEELQCDAGAGPKSYATTSTNESQRKVLGG